MLEVPFWIARDDAVFLRYRRLSESLLGISQHSDPIYRQIALEQLDQIDSRTAEIAEGSLTFERTEAWRMVYEQLLRSPGLHRYRSVAWVQSPDYWQDEPGRKSLALNYDLQSTERLAIERIAIVADELWPAGDVWPVESVRQWLHEQFSGGIDVRFVRQSALTAEPELLADMGNRRTSAGRA